MYIGLHIQYLLFSSDFNETWIFYTDFFLKLPKCQLLRKSDRCGPICSMRTGGRVDRLTHMTKLRVAFEQNIFVERASKNSIFQIFLPIS